MAGRVTRRDYIKTHLKNPVELIKEAAPQNEIISIGEEHNNDNLRRYIAGSVIPVLDSLGYDFLAVEIGSAFQHQMNDYLHEGRGKGNDLLFFLPA